MIVPPLTSRRRPFPSRGRRCRVEKTGPVALAREHLFTCNRSPRTTMRWRISSFRAICDKLRSQDGVAETSGFRDESKSKISPSSLLNPRSNRVMRTWNCRSQVTALPLLSRRRKEHSYSIVVFCLAFERATYRKTKWRHRRGSAPVFLIIASTSTRTAP